MDVSADAARSQPHVLLVEEKVLDAEREKEAGGFVQPVPSNATTNAETTQLGQRART